MKFNLPFLYLLITCLILFNKEVLAQNLYAEGGIGYGLALAPQHLPITWNGLTYSINEYKGKREVVKGSFGKGLNLNANLGYRINKHLSGELGIGYLIGAPYFILNSDSYLGERELELKMSGRMTRASLMIRITTSGTKVQPYLKFGSLVGFFGRIIYVSRLNTVDINNQSEVREQVWELSGNYSFGWKSAMGVSISINDQLALFGQITVIVQTYAPTKAKLTEATHNGEDDTHNWNTYMSQKEFVDSYTPSHDNDFSKPEKMLKQWFPFSSAGFNIGVSYSLHKN